MPGIAHMVKSKNLVIFSSKNKSKHSTIPTTTITVALMLEKRRAKEIVALEILTLNIAMSMIDLHALRISPNHDFLKIISLNY